MKWIKEKVKRFKVWILGLFLVGVVASPILFGDVPEAVGNQILWNQEIVEKRDYGSIHYRNSDGTVTAIFAGGLHFKNDSGEFRRVRETLVDKGTNFETEQTKYALSLPKTFQSPKTLAGEEWNHIASNNVQGELYYIGDTIDSQPIYGVKYPEAFDGVDVFYKPYWNGIHEDYVIKTPTSRHTFEIDIPVQSKKQVLGKTKIQTEKLNIDTFKIVDSAGKVLREGHNQLGPTKELEPDIVTAANKITIDVPVQSADKYPITLDPTLDSDSANSGAVDCKISNDNANGTAWATLHNETSSEGATCSNSTWDWYYYNMYGANSYETIDRWGLFFDTSSLGATATISSSTLKITPTVLVANTCGADPGDVANDNMDLIYVYFKPASSSTVAGTGDFDAFGDEIAAEKAEQIAPELGMYFNAASNQTGRGRALYSTTTYSQYFALTGTTTLGVIVRGDQSDVNPGYSTGACGNTWAGTANATEAIRPILLVEYTLPAVPSTAQPNNKYVPGFMGWLVNKVYAKGMSVNY